MFRFLKQLAAFFGPRPLTWCRPPMPIPAPPPKAARRVAPPVSPHDNYAAVPAAMPCQPKLRLYAPAGERCHDGGTSLDSARLTELPVRLYTP